MSILSSLWALNKVFHTRRWYSSSLLLLLLPITLSHCNRFLPLSSSVTCISLKQVLSMAWLFLCVTYCLTWNIESESRDTRKWYRMGKSSSSSSSRDTWWQINGQGYKSQYYLNANLPINKSINVTVECGRLSPLEESLIHLKYKRSRESCSRSRREYEKKRKK